MGDFTNPNDEALFASIGRLTLSWGHLEAGIDALVDVIFQAYGNPPGDKKIPWALSDKIRYLRCALPILAGEGEATDEHLRILDEIKIEAETRHDIIHSFVIEHNEGDGHAKAIRLIHKKTFREMKHIDLIPIEIIKAAIRANDLAKMPFRLAYLLLEESDETSVPIKPE